MVPSPHPWPYPSQPILPRWPSPLPLAPFRDGTGWQFSTPVSQFLILMHKVEPSHHNDPTSKPPPQSGWCQRGFLKAPLKNVMRPENEP